jgi:stress-induced morphogen
MQPCANKTVAMGNLVSSRRRIPFESFPPSLSLASCVAADLSIQVVSEEFVGKVRLLNYLWCVNHVRRPRKTTMERHRMIYAALAEELKNGLHALSLNAKTHAEILKAEARTPR